MRDETGDGGRDFVRMAGLASIAAGLAVAAHAVAHLARVLAEGEPGAAGSLAATAFMAGSILIVVAFAGLYRHVLNGDAGFALLALLLGAVSGIGGLINGGYDLAIALAPEGSQLPQDVPNPMNPRGLLSHGVGGLAVVVAGIVIARRGLLSRALAAWSHLTGGTLIVAYLAQLLIVRETHPVVVGLAAVAGLLTLPAWLIWLGVELRRTADRRL
jgi:hypothetical protein